MNINMWVEVSCGWNCWAEGLEEEQKRRFMDEVRADVKPVAGEEGAGDERV